MSYGKSNPSPDDFTSDEKVELALKTALGRIQSDLKRDWYKEPKDYVPKTPSELYRYNIPNYNDIKDYLIIDPGIDNAETEMVTNITVNEVVNGETFCNKKLTEIESGFTKTGEVLPSQTDDNKNAQFSWATRTDIACRSKASLTNISLRTFVSGTNSKQIIGLGPNCFTRYNYHNGVTDSGGITRYLTGRNYKSSSSDSIEPYNALLTLKGDGTNNASAARVLELVNNARLGTKTSDSKYIFYNDLKDNAVSLDIIAPADKGDLTKRHPFLKVYLQVPTYPSATLPGSDNICFHNPVMEKSLGDDKGYFYRISGWNTSDTVWATQTTAYPEKLFYFSNPGLIIIYGQNNVSTDSLFSSLYAPMVTFLRYTGGNFPETVISQGDTLPVNAVAVDKDLFINTSNDTINRYDDNTGWVEIGGGGGGGTGSSFVNNSNQTFFDIITQQPNQFKTRNSQAPTTSTIYISWNYDDILANQTANILAKLSFQTSEKNKSLPFINEIKLDISGNTSVNANNAMTWLNLHTISIGNADDYNIDSFKTYQLPKTALSQATNSDTLNILSKTDKFDVRIYGINYAQNHPDIDTRALIFKDLQFLQANAPSIPQFYNEQFAEGSPTLRYYVNEPEQGNTASSAIISEVITDYSQHETLSSSIHQLVSDNETHTQTENTRMFFSIILSNLRYGTKYNYKVKAKNNFRDNYSDYSTPRISKFFQLPSNNGISTTLNFNSNESKTYITTPSSNADLDNSYVYYLNSSLNSTFNLSDLAFNQTIQISNPYSIFLHGKNSNQQNTLTGYGKWIDNSQNLVQVECYINSSLKQTISFNGFDTTNNNAGTSNSNFSNSNIFNYFQHHSQSDMFEPSYVFANDTVSLLDTNKKGFRIKGILDLAHITSVLTNIGIAQKNKHTVEYKYIRHADVGGSSTNTVHNVYIDTLSALPSSVSPITSSRVRSLIYTMGIPSVKTTDISMNRTYHNINSENLYIPGNGIIAKINSISKTNKSIMKNIIIDRNSIVSNGQYNFDFNNIRTQTDSYYYGTYYTQDISGGSSGITSLTISENSISLNSSRSTPSNFNVNHFFDSASYNNIGKISINRKFTYTDVYEIADEDEIAKLNTDVGHIGITQYTSANNDAGHKKIPKDWTLLYLGGKFRTNANKIYPNVNNFQYDYVDNLHVQLQYSAGTTAYSTAGISDPNGYKWIVFKLTKDPSPSGGYSMMGLTIPIDQNDDGLKYLDLDSALSKFFKASTIDALLSLTNTDAIGFCRATKYGVTTKIMGSFKQPYHPQGGNWILSGTGIKSYSDISSGDMKFGAIVDDGSSGRGIYISKTAIKDDLKIFIGLKNNWSE